MSIGILGITFHTLFKQSTALSFDVVIPMLDSGSMVEIYKWIICSILILPQTILLGMTFPNMANAAIRRYPKSSGQLIGILYFSNSAGAALGALISAFILIRHFGLPGSMLAAGIINILIAICAYLLSSEPEPASMTQDKKSHTSSILTSTPKLLLWSAAITGAASFIYEVTWIRMLSMIIGSAFHSFEIMLSAFIAGLALGGLWMRFRIKHIQNKTQYLAFVQLLMGLLAIVSLYLYNHAFELMSFLLQALQRNEEGYLFYNLGSHVIAFFIMLPATTLAGMTLPLITSSLIDKGRGEKSIGQVYASNTLGAIAGVLFAVHIGFTTLGIKGLIITGGFLDIAIGWLLLSSVAFRGRKRRKSFAMALMVSILSLGFSVISKPDTAYMASSVFRGGKLDQPDNSSIFHSDGKTSTISVTRSTAGLHFIATNGKTDASISMGKSGIPSLDEYTMTMLGALPILLRPDARQVANIGLGSGLTSDVLLGSPVIQNLDTIEIEKQMLEGAHLFQPRVSRIFNDPRSNIIIDDARTFFSRNQTTYDIIVSEPSNPWVSGVASLFTTEFYQDIRKHLNHNGLFVQWIHGYELNNQLLASVINSFSPYFSDYTIYAGAASDLIIVLTKNGAVPTLPDQLPQYNGLKDSLNAIGFTGTKDIAPLHIANKSVIDAVTNMYGAVVNSDYFPILQIHAPKQMYMKNQAHMMLDIAKSPIPINSFLNPTAPEKTGLPIDHEFLIGNKKRFDALAIIDVLSNSENKLSASSTSMVERLNNLSAIFNECRAIKPSASLADILWFAKATLPHIDHHEIAHLFSRVNSCKNDFQRNELSRAIQLIVSVSERNLTETIKYSRQYLKEKWADNEWNKYIVATEMMAEAASGNHHKVTELWNNHGSRYFGTNAPFHINLILSYSRINL